MPWKNFDTAIKIENIIFWSSIVTLESTENEFLFIRTLILWSDFLKFYLNFRNQFNASSTFDTD